jgi:hypothetical protein
VANPGKLVAVVATDGKEMGRLQVVTGPAIELLVRFLGGQTVPPVTDLPPSTFPEIDELAALPGRQG